MHGQFDFHVGVELENPDNGMQAGTYNEQYYFDWYKLREFRTRVSTYMRHSLMFLITRLFLSSLTSKPGHGAFVTFNKLLIAWE